MFNTISTKQSKGKHLFGEFVEFQIIPLRAKQVEEFIEIRHKKISPTHILRTLGCL